MGQHKQNKLPEHCVHGGFTFTTTRVFGGEANAVPSCPARAVGADVTKSFDSGGNEQPEASHLLRQAWRCSCNEHYAAALQKKKTVIPIQSGALPHLSSFTIVDRRQSETARNCHERARSASMKFGIHSEASPANTGAFRSHR